MCGCNQGVCVKGSEDREKHSVGGVNFDTHTSAVGSCVSVNMDLAYQQARVHEAR